MIDRLKELISAVLNRLRDAIARYNDLLTINAQLTQKLADTETRLAEALANPPAADEAIAAANRAAAVAQQEAATAKEQLELLKLEDATEASAIQELVTLLEPEAQ